MSEKQRPTYFKWNGVTIKGKGKKLPKSFYNDKNFDRPFTHIEDLKAEYKIGKFIKGKLTTVFGVTSLINNSDGNKYLLMKLKKGLDQFDLGSYEPIISNPKKVGTPKHYLIRGQDVYSGNLREHQRGFVVGQIKECYKPYLKDVPKITDYPVKIRCELHDTIKNQYGKSKDELGGRWDVDNFIYLYNKAFPDLLVSEGILRDDDRLHLPSSIGTTFHPIEKHEDRKLVYIIEKDNRFEGNKTFIDWLKSINYIGGIDPIKKEIKDGESNPIF